VQLIRRVQGSNDVDTLNPYADEALRRFRLDLVDIEQETVAEQPASIDRVRECFRALVRSLEISDDDGDDEEEDYFSAPPPTRNMVCLVLNADTVRMLAEFDSRSRVSNL